VSENCPVPSSTKTILRRLGAWGLALLVVLLRWSARVRLHGDPRPALRAANRRYAYAILHCHQLAAIVACERGTGAMVSQSADGELLIPILRVHGIVPFRGSSRLGPQEKGGAAALESLIDHVRGGRPAYLAVDGPRGPRNHVQRGIAALSIATGAAVLIAVPVPARRWIVARAWDRLQIPKPFTRLDVYFGTPLRAQEGEDVEAFRERIEEALMALEERHDPGEAAAGKVAAAARRARLEREMAGLSIGRAR
jgi:lysophospholipid acyltransferase (LPLAT)-like uncharacterized protein